MKNKTLEVASHETFFDSLKWVVFSIFFVVYFGLKDRYPLESLIFLGLFVIVLFGINIIKEIKNKKIQKLLDL